MKHKNIIDIDYEKLVEYVENNLGGVHLYWIIRKHLRYNKYDENDVNIYKVMSILCELSQEISEYKDKHNLEMKS